VARRQQLGEVGFRRAVWERVLQGSREERETESEREESGGRERERERERDGTSTGQRNGKKRHVH